ncbi:MAG: rolling circle replication-associated protein [Candidatus Aquicultorales bacterium]
MSIIENEADRRKSQEEMRKRSKNLNSNSAIKILRTAIEVFGEDVRIEKIERLPDAPPVRTHGGGGPLRPPDGAPVGALRLEHRTELDKTSGKEATPYCGPEETNESRSPIPKKEEKDYKNQGKVSAKIHNYGNYYAEMGYCYVSDREIEKKPRGLSEDRELNIERSNRRAKSQVRKKTMAMQADRLLSNTFQKPLEDIEIAWSMFERFVRLVRQEIPDWKYVSVVEIQAKRLAKTGKAVPHFHIAVKGRQDYTFLRQCWRQATGYYGGNIHVENPPDWIKGRKIWKLHKIANYLCKYIGKDLGENRELNKQAYRVSEGIEIPTEIMRFTHVGAAVAWFNREYGVGYHYEVEGAVAGWVCSWKMKPKSAG